MCGTSPYQIPIFNDNTTGILGLHWARQLGKSTVLAAWAVDRLLTRPGRLVTVLSNCQQNGAEFAEKCQAICAEHGAIFEAESRSVQLDLFASETVLAAELFDCGEASDRPPSDPILRKLAVWVTYGSLIGLIILIRTNTNSLI